MRKALRTLYRQLPRRVQRPLDQFRGIPPAAHFLHVGKTGGTAVKHALRSEVAVGGRYRIVLHGHQFSVDQLPKGEPFFFFVRDPVSRFVSGFYTRQRQGRPRYDSPWRPGEDVAFRRFETANELAEALSSANVEERRAAEDAMGAIQHVKDSYWSWLHDERTLKRRRGDILFVGSQEHLATDFITLRSLLGLSDSVTLPNNNIEAHRNPESLDRSLSPEAQANLLRWYVREYACLDALRKHFPNLPNYQTRRGEITTV